MLILQIVILLLIVWCLVSFFFLAYYLKISFSRSSGRIVIKNTEYNRTESENLLVDCVKSHKQSLKIVAGPLCPDVYSKKFAEAVRENPTLKITIICGPRIFVENGENPVLQLAKENRIRLFYSRELQPLHFRIVDDLDVYVEEPHLENAKERTTYVFKNNPFEVKTYNKRFARIIRSDLVIECKDDKYPFELINFKDNQK